MYIKLLPEIYCFIIANLFLFAAFKNYDFKKTYKVGLIATFANIILVALTLKSNVLFFDGSYKVDLFSQSVKLMLAIGLFFVVFMSDERSEEATIKRFPELMFFMFTANLGMMMLSSAIEFLTLFLSLELSSYSIFVLAGFLRGKKVSVEASVKYVFMGALSSAVTIYGFSLLFAYFGAPDADLKSITNLLTIKQNLSKTIPDMLMYVSLFFFLSAFFFKLAILPFSFWAPDVYQASSMSVTSYIATVSKVAGVAVLIRIFSYFSAEFLNMQNALLVVAVLTMTFGNVVAVQQKDIKRLLAYSSIAQAGYMMVGFVIMDVDGSSATLFYVFSYLVMNFTVFLIADQLVKDKHSSDISIFKGLSERSPLLAMSLLVALLSLGGVPPFVGFTGKWFIFTSAINKGFLTLVVVAFLNSVVSVYYYLLVARQAYLFNPDEKSGKLDVKPSVRAYNYFAITFIMVCGFYPTAMLNWMEKAVRMLAGQ